MTRARSALYMITAPRVSKQPNATQQCESLLQSVLGQPDLFKQPEAVLYQEGNPEWYLARTVPGLAASAIGAAETPLVAEPTIRLRTAADTAPRRGYHVAAPSSIGAMTAPQLDRLFTVNETMGAAIGTLIHACFEQVQWLDQSAGADLLNAIASKSTITNAGASKSAGPTPAQLRQAIMNSLTPEELRHVSVDKELANFARMLKLDSVRGALSRSRYDREFAGLVPDEVIVENERRISLILGGQLIDGTIDRLVILKHQGRVIAAEILDYKTDRLDVRIDTDLWTRERVEHHRPQLRAYAQVVSQMLKLPIERIDCSLLLLSGDRCVRCDDHAPPAPHLKYKQLTLAW